MLDKTGLVSIWIGDFKSQKQLSKYLEEMYWDDENHPSKFAVEFELFDYDDFGIETRHVPQKTMIEALLGQLSFAASFVDAASARARQLGFFDATTTIAIFDYTYTPRPLPGKTQLTFLGAFPYLTRS